MVDEAGQDLVEVEPAADVAGDAAERVRAMELVADLVGAPAHRDDRADATADEREQVGVESAEVVGPAATTSTPHGRRPRTGIESSRATRRSRVRDRRLRRPPTRSAGSGIARLGRRRASAAPSTP